ncbi:MAG: hydroxymethylpyrimidine/phosphomethylpyrimidine kinase [Gammaproteobacteria bacterium]|nr:hydroxymethylpyrimidine/phosphomethylpyrimidine kinase [Gammaproteobacteria bacterium]
MSVSKPNVMCFSGLDPTGGAGIQADIETLFSTGCHCLPIVTAITVQNTQNASNITPTDPALIVQQARAVLEDIPVQCFKIGLLGDVAAIEVLHTLLRDYPDIPVVLDPVIRAGGGFAFGSANTIDAIRSLLLPVTTVLTPNIDEIMQLAPTADSAEACANEILESGCQHILLTGTHAATKDVVNKFFSSHEEFTLFSWPRLEHSYHGSGCTLAASLAGYLAHGLTLRDAVQQSQRFTWEALNHGSRIGLGQHIPNRSAWNKQSL